MGRGGINVLMGRINLRQKSRKEIKSDCLLGLRGEQKNIWVPWGTIAPYSNSVGMGPTSLEAHNPLMGSNSYVGPKFYCPSVSKAGDCSKTSHFGLGPGQINPKYGDW